MRNIDWPEPCREKIGIRLEVVNIPIVRYKSNIAAIENNFMNAVPEGAEATKGSTKPVATNKTVAAGADEAAVNYDCDYTNETENCTSTVTTYIEYQ